MDLQTWTYIIVGVTFALYIELQSGLAPDQLKNFMLQEEISPLANGMATAADWMSAASSYRWPESFPLMAMMVLFI
jgi:cation/acetate symporter